MWFFGLIVVLLIGAVAVVASGRWGAMAPAYDDRPDLTVPARQALTSDDIETARFGVGLRGYRMDEVDTLLERVAREVAERDRRIADLERAVSPIIHGPEGAGFTSRSEYAAADFDDTGYTKPIMVGGDFPESQQEPTTAEQPAVETHQPEPEAPPAALEEPPAPTEQQPQLFEEPPARTDLPQAPPPQPESLGMPPAATEQYPAPPPLGMPPAAADQYPAPQSEALGMPPAATEQYPAPDLFQEPPAPAERHQAPPPQPETFRTPPISADQFPPPPPAPEPWFDEPETSALDDQPHPPAQVPPTASPVPLPPLLQELVHPADDTEGESWFQAKEPPPDHNQPLPPLPEQTGRRRDG